MQQQHQQEQQHDKWSLSCIKKTQTKINMDCIKVCPLDSKIWAFAYYQQNPQFCGGVQVQQIQEIVKGQVQFGAGTGYLQMGPIMHIQWLCRSSQGSEGQLQYYILGAARDNQAIICKYTPSSKHLLLQKRIPLGTQIFCLYCDWQPFPNPASLSATVAISSNQSTVYTFQICLTNFQTTQITEYNKHEYAVWVCKINKYQEQRVLMVCGDQVDRLYLYDLGVGLIGKNRTAHTQGICQLVWRSKNVLMSGSFDGSISQICVTNFAQTLRRFAIQGTIWRIIPISQCTTNKQHEHLLICNSSIKKFQLIKYPICQQWDSGQQHTSLAYAADYSGSKIITASFYDKEVRIWNIQH